MRLIITYDFNEQLHVFSLFLVFFMWKHTTTTHAGLAQLQQRSGCFLCFRVDEDVSRNAAVFMR